MQDTIRARELLHAAWFAARSWSESPGVVYLFRCVRTGECKFGATNNPFSRFHNVIRGSQRKHSRDLVYLWSIITNGIGLLESYWRREWEPHRIRDGRLEWVNLPDAEVARFKSVRLVNWKRLPPVSDELRDSLSPLPTDHRYRKPWRTLVRVSPVNAPMPE